jgi:hypothetical protein
MKRIGLGVTFVFGLGLVVAVGAGVAQERKAPGTQEQPADAMSGCMEMMQGAGAGEAGRKAMREFMQSDRAPQAMANMMAMARRMGHGDVMLGMTRMMEMMGSMGGGMMGGQGGMMRPGGARPGK